MARKITFRRDFQRGSVSSPETDLWILSFPLFSGYSDIDQLFLSSKYYVSREFTLHARIKCRRIESFSLIFQICKFRSRNDFFFQIYFFLFVDGKSSVGRPSIGSIRLKMLFPKCLRLLDRSGESNDISRKWNEWKVSVSGSIYRDRIGYERFEVGIGFDGLSRPLDRFSRHRPPIVERILPLCLSRNVAYDTRARASNFLAPITETEYKRCASPIHVRKLIRTI